MPGSDCAYAQSDADLRCPHMPEHIFAWHGLYYSIFYSDNQDKMSYGLQHKKRVLMLMAGNSA